jgi:hypothetical protein
MTFSPSLIFDKKGATIIETIKTNGRTIIQVICKNPIKKIEKRTPIPRKDISDLMTISK